jgi:hypothetical protein
MNALAILPLSTLESLNRMVFPRVSTLVGSQGLQHKQRRSLRSRERLSPRSRGTLSGLEELLSVLLRQQHDSVDAAVELDACSNITLPKTQIIHREHGDSWWCRVTFLMAAGIL